MKPLNYEISCIDHPVVVGGFAVGEFFAVDHRQPGEHWILTDVRSGCAAGEFLTRKDAIRIGEALERYGWPRRAGKFGVTPKPTSAFMKAASQARARVLADKELKSIVWTRPCESCGAVTA